MIPLDKKRGVCQLIGVISAAVATIAAIGQELGFLPYELAGYVLDAMIVVLAISLIGSFYFKKKE